MHRPALWLSQALAPAGCADRAPRSAALARGSRSSEVQGPRHRTSGSAAARESEVKAGAQTQAASVPHSQDHPPRAALSDETSGAVERSHAPAPRLAVPGRSRRSRQRRPKGRRLSGAGTDRMQARSAVGVRAMRSWWSRMLPPLKATGQATRPPAMTISTRPRVANCIRLLASQTPAGGGRRPTQSRTIRRRARNSGAPHVGPDERQSGPITSPLRRPEFPIR